MYRRSDDGAAVKTWRSQAPRPATDEWKQRVRDELKKRGRGAQAALARQLGCASTMITWLLRPPSDAYPGCSSSPLVPHISRALGIPEPLPDSYSRLEAIVGAMQRWLEVDPDGAMRGIDTIVAHIEAAIALSTMHRK